MPAMPSSKLPCPVSRITSMAGSKGLDPGQHIQTTHIGHSQIEDHDIGMKSRDCSQTLFAGKGAFGLKLAQAKTFRQGRGEVHLVVDDQYLHFFDPNQDDPLYVAINLNPAT